LSNREFSVLACDLKFRYVVVPNFVPDIPFFNDAAQVVFRSDEAAVIDLNPDAQCGRRTAN